MVNKSEIKEHAPVVASCGHHVGTVDHLDGERIKLAKTIPNLAANTIISRWNGSIKLTAIKWC